MPLTRHNCRERNWEDGSLTFICSRCGRCYACRHKAIYFEIEDRWIWKCADGNLREVINDGRLS